jgi:hypothetical protein
VHKYFNGPIIEINFIPSSRSKRAYICEDFKISFISNSKISCENTMLRKKRNTIKKDEAPFILLDEEEVEIFFNNDDVKTYQNDALFSFKIFLLYFYRTFVSLSIFVFLIFFVLSGEGLVYWLEYIYLNLGLFGVLTNLISNAIWGGQPQNPGSQSAAASQIQAFTSCSGPYCPCPQITQC